MICVRCGTIVPFVRFGRWNGVPPEDARPDNPFATST